MYDQRTEAVFDLDNKMSTMRPEWWQNAEPIWISATREKKRVFQRYWSRCEVPFEEIMPNGECTGYEIDKGINAIQTTLNVTLQKLKDYDLLMIYGEHIDNIGHAYGPDSFELAHALKELNRVFKGFLDELMDKYYDIYKELNIVIVSDHGMKGTGPGSNVTYVSLGHYVDINDVMKVLGAGAIITIAPLPRNIGKVYLGLKRMPGVDVYTRDEIPEEYHYKNNRLVLDILVIAKPNYFIRGFPSSDRYGHARNNMHQKQIPQFDQSVTYFGGTHGYPPSVIDMRAIFFAKGPAFKKGIVHPPIHLVDIYQVLTRVLNIKPNQNNGSWPRVSGIFANSSVSNFISFRLLCLTVIFICIWFHP